MKREQEIKLLSLDKQREPKLSVLFDPHSKLHPVRQLRSNHLEAFAEIDNTESIMPTVQIIMTADHD